MSFSSWIAKHWIVLFGGFVGLYVGLPILAPVFMHLGWNGLGSIIYKLYATQCHQLPQRSFFLFGQKAMYSLNEIQSAWREAIDPFVLRQFLGNPQMGWKIAWSDRMVSMYTSLLICGLLWWSLRKRITVRLPWWGFAIFLLPLAIDGFTHFVSDLAGLGQGFRDMNAWLSIMTGNAFPADFYAGDALGSFNSWMRLLTGVLFGMGIVWYAFPYLDEVFSGMGE